MWVSASVFIGCCAEPPKDCNARFLSSLIVLGIGSCSLNGFQFRQVIGWTFPQSLLYLCLCTSYKDTFWIEGLWMGCWPYPYTGSPSWLQEVTISWSIFFTARSLRLRHLHRHPGYSYCPRSLVHTRDSLPCPLPFCILSLLLYLHLITHNPALPTLLLSYQVPSFHSSLIDILFPLLRKI